MIGLSGILMGLIFVMYINVDVDKKKVYKGIFLFFVFVVFLIGVIELIEYMFMFVVFLFYFVYVVI